MMNLRKIHMKVFKSNDGQSGQDIPLGDITLLFGANGSGKSNLVSFFKMLNDMTSEALQQYVGKQGVSNLLFYGPKKTESIAFKLYFESEEAHDTYEVQLSYGLPDRLFVSGEKVAFHKNGKSQPQEYFLSNGVSEIGLKKDKRQTSKVVYGLLSGIRTYQFHDTSDTAKIKDRGYVDDGKYLRSDAGNLAAFLKMLKQHDEYGKYYERIVRHIRRVMPQFGDFDLESIPVKEDYVRLNWTDSSGSDYLFSPDQISDGLLRFMALPTLLLQPPEQKFLLYRQGSQPPDLENWLLDVQLAQGEFRTDQVAIWLSELELGPEFTDVLQDNTEFFQSIHRMDSIKKLLQADDTAGHNRDSEELVFEAVEETLQELIRLIKKLTGANVNNLLVTSDHGFIYQNRATDESDFSAADAEGGQILFRDRRFVLGKGLTAAAGLHKFTPEQLGLAGEVEVQIPKSINRLRLKGSGSRFVHGGAALQEVVIPVLKINKKRQSDVSTVEVDILRGASSMITSGQLAVIMYQTRPVTDKIQPRVLRAGIYTASGELISDSHDLTFDLNSDNPREREVQVCFVLTRKADAANGQEVTLKLEEKHAGTSHYKEYKSLRYTIRRSFTSDFDFKPRKTRKVCREGRGLGRVM